ncbi:MAG: cyclic nucleotide-binding domain-containing protein [Spirochaetia bacterium]|nr:cyclic nucleotide-binding domain-containing protein [Spirochaetia bacterium]
MQFKVKVSKIPFFKYITPEIAGKLVALFKVQTYNKHDIILSFGQDVPGFYIIVQGEVVVHTENYESVLANLKEGHGFGEMSLIDNQKASANVKAFEKRTKVLFCDSDAFKRLISEDFIFAAAFYKGVSSILSERLRRTNLLIETEMNKTRGIIKNLMQTEGIEQKLGIARKSIDGTGEGFINKLNETIPALDAVVLKAPDSKADIEAIKDNIRKVITIDSQNFDIIAQQVERINKYFQNIYRLLEGENVDHIAGDKNIFEVDLDKGPVDSDDAITFF